MIPRYTRPEMGRIWSDENKFRRWLDVEVATAEVEAEAGLIPRSAARAIRRKGRFSVERILEIEKRVHFLPTEQRRRVMQSIRQVEGNENDEAED